MLSVLVTAVSLMAGPLDQYVEPGAPTRVVELSAVGPLWVTAGVNVTNPSTKKMRVVATEEGPPPPFSRQRANLPAALSRTTDGAGNVYSCTLEHSIVKTDAQGVNTVIALAIGPKGLNGPHDVVALPSGDLLFTDPPRPSSPTPTVEPGVYRATPAKPGEPYTLELVAKGFEVPDGITTSPDGATVYVADAGTSTIKSMTVDAAGKVSAPKVFADLRTGGGQGSLGCMRADVAGNLYAAGVGGVWVITPAGEPVGPIMINKPTGMCFGGKDFKTLFVTTPDGVYAVKTKNAGAMPKPGAPAAPAVPPAKPDSAPSR